MAKSRLIGDYPVIGIRPTIDGRRGVLKVRESLEEQTMNMAKSAAKLFEENLRYTNGEPVKVVIADTTIGRVAESAACADKFKKEGVDITLTVTTMLVLRRRDNGYGSDDDQSCMGIQRNRETGSSLPCIRTGYTCTERTSGIRNLRTRCM